MAALPEMRYHRDGGGGNILPARLDDGHRRRRRGGLRRQLLDTGRAMMMLGALVLTWRRRLAACCNPEHALAGFALWLLGVALATLSLVAGQQFPRLAAAGAALARALRSYLLGGL
ncbi:unnamed protein product [Urochloa decumbens]|uniref:Uncharacterized protein n=1 Tax=Urochloa decumbens TaxID=240449 RepID=A0ABC9AL08_9POAL